MTPYEERFWSKVDKSDGCWLWTGGCTGNGYGAFWNGQRDVPAHRFAYEAWVDLIPVGMELDHLCRTPRCVRPDHLEPVTHCENMHRGDHKRPRDAGTCAAGHEFAGANVYVDPRGRRGCRVCQRAAVARYRARRRVKVAA